MSWTNPRTWVLGELVSETLLNTHLRDNLNFLKSDPLIAEATDATSHESGVFQTITILTLSNIAISSEVGKVYCEAWAPFVQSTQSQGGNAQGAVYITDSVAGTIAQWRYSLGTFSGFYLRTRDLAWSGSTHTVSLTLEGNDADSFMSGSAAAPIVLRMVRSY